MYCKDTACYFHGAGKLCCGKNIVYFEAKMIF